jgi:chromosome segregation ATPase
MPSTGPLPAPDAPPPAALPDEPEPSGKQRPTLWIVLTCLFAAAAIGLGIWAGTLKADLDDQDDRIAELQRAVEEAEQQAAAVGDAAVDEIAALEQQVADLEATVAAQQETAEGSAAEAEQVLRDAQSQVDAANEQLGTTAEALAATEAELEELRQTSDAAIADAEAAAEEAQAAAEAAQGAAAEAEARAAEAEAEAAAEKARADLAEGCLKAVADLLGRIYDVEDPADLPAALKQASEELAQIAPTCAPPSPQPA